MRTLAFSLLYTFGLTAGRPRLVLFSATKRNPVRSLIDCLPSWLHLDINSRGYVRGSRWRMCLYRGNANRQQFWPFPANELGINSAKAACGGRVPKPVILPGCQESTRTQNRAVSCKGAGKGELLKGVSRMGKHPFPPARGHLYK